MKTKSLLMLSALSGSFVFAQTVLVDFGSSNSAGFIGGNYFNVWNPGNNVDLILASDGTSDSGWNLDSTTPGAANNGSSPDYVFTSPFPGAPNPFNDDSIASDALNLTPTDGVRNVRFFNLDPSTEYSLTIYGAREASQTRITTYSVLNDGLGSVLDTGSLTTSGTGIGTGANYNNDTLLNLSATTDADGEIILQYAATTGDFGYLNAVQLTQIPEPSTFLLVGLAGVTGLITYRRLKA